MSVNQMKKNNFTVMSSISSASKAEDLMDEKETYPESLKMLSTQPYNKDLVVLTKANSEQAESLRMLRSQLMLRWFNNERHTLAILGANAHEGCSYVVANLSVLFAQLGMRTLLVDANLRAPKQHEIFNLKLSIGLSELLAVDANIEVIPHAGPVENLSILCAGAIPSNPLELLSRKSFAQLINQVKTHFDVVLIDTSPAIVSADAQTVVAHCDGAMLVSRLNKTKLADLTEVKNQISITGAQIVGGVVNQF
jgi:protein-tyrosine kinase